ncbi:MAG: trypsin-like peptidase domain-containing protein [Bacteroidales bacterium]|nr:trypsin-like peptidase domain-containing protein [Bacteroidales bacterium]
MKAIVLHIQVLLLLLLATGSLPLAGQLQFSGKALGLNSGLKAAEVMYVLPPVDPLEIEAEKELNRISHSKPLRFAVERPVNLTPETHGSWSHEAGLLVWRVHILSPEAYSLGLVFADYELMPGVKLFVYDPFMKEVKGAFTSGNNKPSRIMPVGHIQGEELLIEMQVPEGMHNYGDLELESLSHAFLKTGFQSSEADDCPAGEFGCSQKCEIDVNCTEGDDWWRVKPSVVRIYTTNFFCTGVLVNNTSYDGTPYVITAEHCLNSQYYADRSVFQFNYESAACFGENGPLDMSLEGATMIAHGDSIDFSLIELAHTPPPSYGVYYAGWDRTRFQTNSTVTLHHPFGDVKKISLDEDIPSIPLQPGDVPYSGLEDYHYFSFWWVKQWDVGSTEGGSSGGPLFNQARRVIGILSGGNAACGDSIDYNYETGRTIYNPAPNYDDYFTQFGMAWDYEASKGNALKPWLDPVNSGVEVLGGYNPSGTEPVEEALAQKFRVFPNPAGELFYITTREPLREKGRYSVVNLSGAFLIHGELDREGRAEIHTSVLPPGLYLIRIEADDHREHHKLLVSGR